MKMKKILLYIFSVCFIATGIAQNNLSAPQVLSKTVNQISNSKGLEVKFNIYNSGVSGKGEMKTAGNKFYVKLPDVEVWYNGKDMYTYNKNAGETTVVLPTSEELSQSNPLGYVTGASSNYNIAFSTVKKNNKYVLDLTPKTKGSEIKRITLTVNKNDFAPEKIVVEPVSGNPITAEITSFMIMKGVQSSEFEYPKSKYSKIVVVDLR